MFVNVMIDSDDLLNQLMERVGVWNTWDDDWIYELYAQYYTNLINEGCFCDDEFDVKTIVDNDWVNNLNYYENVDEAENDFGSSWNDNRIVAKLQSGEVLVNCH